MTSKTTTKYAPEVREGAVRRVFYANFRVYGVRRVWRQPQREGLDVARCTFAQRIVGWRASRTAHAGLLLDALEQALHDRRPTDA